MTTASTQSVTRAVPTRLIAGVLGGVAGGVVFGVLMHTMEMMPMVAMLVGSTSVAVGWLLHLVISAFIGAAYAVLFARYIARPVPAAVIGMLYGALWWVLGALLLMPARLGMDVFMLNTMAWRSLLGHLLFGLVLGVTYALVSPRLQQA